MLAPVTRSASSGRVRVRRSARVGGSRSRRGGAPTAAATRVTDRRLEAGTYRLRFALRVDGRAAASGLPPPGRTVSFVAAMGDEERAALLGEVRELAGGGTMTLRCVVEFQLARRVA